jgi:branched-chain amino acid transport system ATP-binding protein
MVAMGRALMAKPKILLMDEPSMGLAPVLVAQNFEIIDQINQTGTTVFMVEQNANMASPSPIGAMCSRPARWS